MDDLHFDRYRRWRREAARMRRVAAEPPAASRLPAEVDVAAIRHRLGRVLGEMPISQAAFARRFGFSVAAVRAWEQGLRLPDVSARVLLLLIDHDPHLVDAVIDEAIKQAAAGPDRVEVPAVELEIVRPSAVPFEVQTISRRLKPKQRNRVPA